MTMPRISPPPSGDQYLARLAAIVNAELDRLEPAIIGWKHDGSNVHVRFRAALATPWVRVHVMSAFMGSPAYDPATFVTSTEVDCRTERLQDVVIPDAPDGPHVVYLIPVQQDGAGAKIKFDGQSGRPDRMAFLDPGVA